MLHPLRAPAPTHRPLADFAAQANAEDLRGDGGGVARPEDAHRDRPDAVEEEIAEVKRSLQQLHRLHKQEEASRGRPGRYARPLELERRRLYARLAVLEPASLLVCSPIGRSPIGRSSIFRSPVRLGPVRLSPVRYSPVRRSPVRRRQPEPSQPGGGAGAERCSPAGQVRRPAGWPWSYKT